MTRFSVSNNIASHGLNMAMGNRRLAWERSSWQQINWAKGHPMSIPKSIHFHFLKTEWSKLYESAAVTEP